MWHKIKDLSPEQRHVIESLLGRGLRDDEGLNIEPSHVLADAPVDDERSRAYSDYLAHLDKIAFRSADVSDEELETVIREACEHARHSPA